MLRSRRSKTPWEDRLLLFFFRGAESREKLEDLEEAARERAGLDPGRRPGRLWRIGQVLRLIGAGFELSAYWSLAIVRNYLTIAWRSLLRSKATAFISVSGLALGIAGFLLVSVWAIEEFGFDRFHKNAASIFRVEERRHLSDRVEPGFQTPGPLSAALKGSFPEVRRAARVAWTGERVLRRGDAVHYEQDILCVDPSFLSIFSFPLRAGNPETALDEPHAMVVTEKFARKYFGDANPLGQVLTLDGKSSFSVTGVLEDVPDESHLQFEALVPFDVVKELGWLVDSWDFSMALTYVELADGADPRLFERKIAGFVKTRDADSPIELVLDPLTRIRLYSNDEVAGGPGRVRYVLIFLLLGSLILLIACVNFMNLSTARAETRAREIGVRKVVGAARGHIARQFLLEAVFVAGLSLLLAPPLLKAALPFFNEVAGASVAWADFLKAPALLLAAGAVLACGLLSGIHPALFLSSFEPSKVMKGRSGARPAGSRLRRGLVVVQVGASVILLVAATVIYLQVDFLKAKDLGFDKERLLSIPLGISNAENAGIYRKLKDTLDGNPRVRGVAAAFTPLTQFGTPVLDGVYYGARRLDEETAVSISSVEAGFFETLGIRLVEGRAFAPNDAKSLVINQAFQKLLGVGSAVGLTLRLGPQYTGTVIGVVADFHMASPSASPIGPLVVFRNSRVNQVFVRLGPGDIAAAVGEVGKAWQAAAPQLPFKYSFLDEDFNGLYRDLDRLAAAIRIFTLLAAFIAGLGLFALASFAVERRRKEVGIRKVMGSSSGKIWLMLSGDLIRLVAGACLVAWPVAWLLMKSWLADFPYRVAIGWEVFALSGLAAFAAALLIVSAHTLKASRANPVDAIRNE
jgi:putative ABC transport system permease protein